jgi:hypothetical protein
VEKHYIVVWDPKNDYWEGSLVDELRAKQLEARGVALLPVQPELFKLAGVGGFAKRAWGSGFPLDHATPRLAAPITLFLPRADDPSSRVRSTQRLHWKARIVPSDDIRGLLAEGKKYEGTLRLSVDNGAASPLHAGFTTQTPPIDMRALGPLDESGGWTVGGHGICTPACNGFFGFALYGAAPGFRIVWLAASIAD